MSDWKSRSTPAAADWKERAASVGTSPAAPAPAEPPSEMGTNPDNAQPMDLYGSDVNRLKAGFGDAKGIEPLLKVRGAVEVKRNSSGEIVAKGSDGKWYRDENEFFKGHPINWLESAIGKAPNTVGMLMGGAAGAALGAPLAPGTAGLSVPAAAIALAGAGSMAGEDTRQYIGGKLGTYSGENRVQDLIDEGIAGAMGEVGGRAINTGLSSFLKSGLGNSFKNAAAKTASTLSGGVPTSATRRMIDNPEGVMKPKSDIVMAEQAAAELKAVKADKSAALKDATKKFHETVGPEWSDTADLTKVSRESLAPVAPDAATGQGHMQEKEYRVLRKKELKNLNAKVFGPAPLEGAIAEPKPVYDPHQQEIFKFGDPEVRMTPVEFTGSKGPLNETIPFTPVKEGNVPGPIIESSRLRWEADPATGVQKPAWGLSKKGNLIDEPVLQQSVRRGIVPAAPISSKKPMVPNGEKYEYSPYSPGLLTTGETVQIQPATPDITYPKQVGFVSQVPQQTNSSLLRTMQGIGQEVSRSFDPENNLISKRSGPYIGYLKQMYGALKNKLHGISPEFGAEAEKFHQFANDEKLLAPVMKPGTQESFMHGLVSGSNKTNQLEAFQKNLPHTSQNLLDAQASAAYANPGEVYGTVPILNLPVTKRGMWTAGMAGAGALGDQLRGGDPSTSMSAAAALAAISHPALQKKLLYMLSQNAKKSVAGAGAVGVQSLYRGYSPFNQ